jgi:kynurenine formamidase
MTVPEEFRELARKVNNWGRWGEDDEVGTLNLITPEVVKRGAACVRTGASFSLALPLSEDGPQTGAVPGRSNPVRSMTVTNAALPRDESAFRTSDDAVTMGLQAATHWDSLAHVSYEGRLYNGFDASSITEAGASRCGIDKIGTVAGRGVLIDVARAKGAERLDPGYAITQDDLDVAERLAATAVSAGDIVLLRTGHVRVLKEGRKRGYGSPSPGPSMACALWFRERDVAAVATDNFTFEVYPGKLDALAFPVHLLHLVEMGLTQGQNFDLEDLAAACADDGVYEFFLEASPEPFVGGLGSPVNPVAIK